MMQSAIPETAGKEISMEAQGESNPHLEKEALMRMIAQQMVSSLLGDEDGTGEDDDIVLKHMQEKLLAREKARKARRKSKRRSSKMKRTPDLSDADLVSPTPTNDSSAKFVSPIPGAEMPFPVSPLTPLPVNPGSTVHEDVEVNIRDDDSFAGGHLHELVDDKYRRGSSMSSRNSAASASSAGMGTRSTGSDTKETTVVSRELSIEEIRKYVMDNIPPAVRDQIPQEAWGQIFNGESTGSKTTSQKSRTSSQNSRKQKESVAPVEQIYINTEEEDVDDITVFSDVSGLTGAFPEGKSVERSREHTTFVLSKLAENPKSSGLDPDVDEEEIETRKPPRSTRGFRNSLVLLEDPVEETKREVLKVSWNQVELRYYERIVTDNPSVQSGPAVGIGWKYKRGGRVLVDDWEEARGTHRKSSELVMPRDVREKILRDAGISGREVADMVRATLKIKNQRAQTVNNLATSGVEEAVEDAKRRLTRLISFGRNKSILK